MGIQLEQHCPVCNGELELTAQTANLDEGQRTDLLISCQGKCEEVWNEFLNLDNMMKLGDAV